MTLLERLEEMEQSPADVDILDMEAFVEACGGDVARLDAVLILAHSKWGMLWTLRADVRTIPVGTVRGILNRCRAELSKEGKL